MLLGEDNGVRLTRIYHYYGHYYWAITDSKWIKGLRRIKCI